MKCQICDKGEVVETEETDYKTTILSFAGPAGTWLEPGSRQEMTIPKALVGRCDTCGAVNYAFRKGALE